MTYSYFAVQYFVLCILYPQLWTDVRSFNQHCTEELRGLPERMRVFQVLAGLIPVIGAALLIFSGPEHLTLSFRLLLIGLLTLGMAGWGIVMIANERIAHVQLAFPHAREAGGARSSSEVAARDFPRSRAV